MPIWENILSRTDLDGSSLIQNKRRIRAIIVQFLQIRIKHTKTLENLSVFQYNIIEVSFSEKVFFKRHYLQDAAFAEWTGDV